MNFDDLGLGPAVLRAVEETGYTEPTPIQEQAIPFILMGRDVLGGAQTGTGKTASFTLPMIEILAEGRAKARMPRSLILCPTRELAAQVAESFDRYGKHNQLTKALLIGGVSFDEQDRLIDRGVDVLIATPGRLLDHFERGKILLNDIKILVIDEADRMLDMGFIPDVERIVDLIPKIRQTLFFSATIPPEIRRLADKFLINPKEVYVAPPASPAALVEQYLCRTTERDKRAMLRRLLEQEDVRNALIFCNRKKEVDVLTDSLKRHGFNAAALHGDMHQEVRTRTLAGFKAGDITMLVASDVAARGLDIMALSHVFNFDVPMNAEDYIHRIGRTGRAGRAGKTFMLATRDDAKYLSAIERLIGKPIPPLDLDGPPDGGAVDQGEQEPAAQKPKRRRGRRSSRRSEKPAETERSETGDAQVEADKADAGEKERRRDKSRKRSERDKQPLAFGDEVPAFFEQEINPRAR